MSAALPLLVQTYRNLLLGDVVTINPKVDRALLSDETLVSFVPMAAVGAGNGKIDAAKIRPYSEVKKGYTNFRDGDVLFAKVTPCMENGKMAVAIGLKNGVGFGSTEFHVLRPGGDVDSRYVYHFVSGAGYRRVAARHMTGAVGLRRVPADFLAKTQFPIPSLGEQRRIVAEIETQFSRLDQAISSLQRALRNIRAYKQSMLSEVFSRADGPPLISLSEVCSVISGFAFKSGDFEKTGIPVVKIANVGYGEFFYKNQEYLPTQFLARHIAFVVEPNDILIALTRPITENTLKVCQYPEGAPEALLNQRVAILRPLEAADGAFLLAQLHSPQVKSQVLTALSQTLQPNLSPSDLRRVRLHWPSKRMRKDVVAECDRRMSIARGVEAQVDANLKRAQALRQAVLIKAFGGPEGAHAPT